MQLLDELNNYVTIPDFYGEQIKIRYWDVGSGDIILLIHGIASSMEIWYPTVKEFSQTHRVIALDLPGHGYSERNPSKQLYRLDNATHFIIAFLNQLGIDEPITVIGNSVGGMIASNLAMIKPDLVKNLILASPAGYGRDVSIFFRLGTIWLIGELFFLTLNRFSANIAANYMVYHRALISDEFLLRTVKYLRTAGTMRSILGALRFEANIFGLKHPYTPEELAKIECPTLFLWGKQDPVTPVHHADYAIKGIENSRLIIFDRAKHTPHIDRIDEFNTAVNNLLKHGIDHFSKTPVTI